MNITLLNRRAGRRTREKWRTERLAVLKRLAAPLLGTCAFALAVAIVIAFLAARHDQTMFGGFLLGVIVTAMVAAVYSAADIASGQHHNKFGTFGEVSTSDTFRSLSFRHKGWKIIDAVVFDRGDVDHVAVGPRGVLAIETKWTNVRWDVTDGRLSPHNDAIGQALRGARKIRLLLRSQHIEVDVLPVLMVWGPGAFIPSFEPKVIQGVLVVRGANRSALAKWIGEFQDSSLSPAAVHDITHALREYTQRFDSHATVTA